MNKYPIFFLFLFLLPLGFSVFTGYFEEVTGFAKYNFSYNDFNGNGDFITTGEVNSSKLIVGDLIFNNNSLNISDTEIILFTDEISHGDSVGQGESNQSIMYFMDSNSFGSSKYKAGLGVNTFTQGIYFNHNTLFNGWSRSAEFTGGVIWFYQNLAMENYENIDFEEVSIKNEEWGIQTADDFYLKQNADETDLDNMILNLTSNGGGIVHLTEGTITFSGSKTFPANTQIISNNCQLSGDGGTINIYGDSSISGRLTIKTTYTNSNNFLMRLYGGNINIDGVYFRNDGGQKSIGIYASSSINRVHISNCDFYNLYMGIKGSGCSYWSVTGNTFNNLDYCLGIYDFSSTWSITGNIAHSNDASAIYIHNARYISITGNIFGDNIYMDGSYTQTEIGVVGNHCSVSGSSIGGLIANNW